MTPGLLLLAGMWAASLWAGGLSLDASAAGDYVVLAWNDLGMHRYNCDFKDLAVLPPYNTLWAQVIKVGDPPQIVTAGIRVTYVFTDNTYSVGKSNFWDHDQQLFGVNLSPNVGLAGKGLSGEMDLAGDHFIAEGIPLTEYRDSVPTTRYPYQLATIIAYDANTNAELARTIAVALVSTEMRCDSSKPPKTPIPGLTSRAATTPPVTAAPSSRIRHRTACRQSMAEHTARDVTTARTPSRPVESITTALSLSRGRDIMGYWIRAPSATLLDPWEMGHTLTLRPTKSESIYQQHPQTREPQWRVLPTLTMLC